MTSALPKRLIEVDLPIKRISAHARREKSIRHGHISTLHIWWARRPLAACRAVICASLWPDPADPECPESFRDTARKWMHRWVKNHLKSLSNESLERFLRFQRDPALLNNNEELRYAMLDFIADFANWDNSNAEEFLETSRGLTQAAHEALGGAKGTKPLVADSFAGGGAIPLEALRIGADTFASDLNPVAVLLNKVVLEFVPKYGQQLADEIRRWGQVIGEECEQELADLYPKDADGRTPATYLWARTIRCEGPNCGAEVPLIRSLWLAKKGKDSVALRLVPKPIEKRVDFEIITNAKASVVGQGTVRRGAATCPCCGYTTPAEHTRAQFKGRKGGAEDSRLLAVVTTLPSMTGRHYRVASERDIKAVQLAAAKLRTLESSAGAQVIPDESLPYLRSIFNIQLLDVNHWRDLFTPRQLIAVSTLQKALRSVRSRIQLEAPADFADALTTCLALAVNRQADYSTSLCSWHLTGEKLNHTYGRQALGIIWDFAEACPFADASGNFEGAYSWVAGVCERVSESRLVSGHVEQASATQHPLPDDSVSAFITDPPYYDAVPYADLSDFFYVWLKRAIGDIYPNLMHDSLTPKQQEAVQLAERNPIYAYKTKANFEALMTQSLAEGRRITQPDGIGVVVFAHKTTGAWETMLQAVIDAGWIIVASWPIDTEMGTRLRAMNSATLSSSVHLVCRPRESGNGPLSADYVGDWRDVLQELPRRIHEWMPRLAEEGVVGADAIFACLGPALEIFSRYSHVEKASGQNVTLREYLEHVWAAVAKEALATVFAGADASGFEEDARVTAIWLWTLFAGESVTSDSEPEEADEEETSEETKNAPKGYVLEYDTARKIAQGLGAHLETLTSLVEIKKDVARLLPVAERTRRLFGKEGGETSTTVRKKKSAQLQLGFIAELDEIEESSGWGTKGAPTLGVTVLDRVHQCMILFAAGRGDALRRLLVDEGAGKDERFWRLAQVLSFLYPKTSDEKRWIDGVLARKKGLGF
jgi:putative DNA methylase